MGADGDRRLRARRRPARAAVVAAREQRAGPWLLIGGQLSYVGAMIGIGASLDDRGHIQAPAGVGVGVLGLGVALQVVGVTLLIRSYDDQRRAVARYNQWAAQHGCR